MPLLARRDVLKSVLAWPLVGRLWPTATAKALPTVMPIPIQAADAYRKAFAWVDLLTEADKAILENWRRVDLGPAVDALLESARPALAAVRQGASQRECDWGIEMNAEGFGQIAPIPFKAHNLTFALLIRARHAAQSGRWEQAMDDIFDVLAYARHEGSTGLILCSLYQQAKEGWAMELLALLLPQLPSTVLEGLPGRLDRLPPRVTWRQVMDAESRLGLALLPEFSPDLSLAGREAFDVAVPQLVAILDQPPGPERQAAVAAWEAESAGETPARHLCLLYPSSRITWEHAEAIRAMLDAAIVRVRDGHEAFLAVRDPFGSGPFAIEARGEGFVLRSAFQGLMGLKTELRVGGVEPGAGCNGGVPGNPAE